MRSQDEPKNSLQTKSFRELGLLSEIEVDPEVTQRGLASRAGMALGLTNLLLKNLAEKGYIRISRAGWKRWLYTLTPLGIARKIQLTIDYIQRVLGQYRAVREIIRQEMETQVLNKESRIAVYGTGEFAELVYLSLREIGIEEVDFYLRAPEQGDKFLGMPVLDTETLRANDYDKVVVADLVNSQTIMMELEEISIPSEMLVTFFGKNGGN